MNIPKYWAHSEHTATDWQGQSAIGSSWGWSNIDLADARQQADLAAQRHAARLLNRNTQPLGRYPYGNRPLREEIVETVSDPGRAEALLTRNAYGALILNTARVMFIDIDLPKAKPNSGGALLGKLFGTTPKPTPEQLALATLEKWAQQNPLLGLRIYRTAGGLRGLVTTDLFDPTHPSTTALLQSLNCDPLYITLCRTQESFRARLTPKPWRCGLFNPPNHYPWKNVAEERRYREWEQEYQSVTASYATCTLIKEIGRWGIHPDIAPLVAMHDRWALGEGPLA